MVSLKNYASIYVFVKTDAVLYHGRLPVSRLRVMLHADWYDSGSEAVCFQLRSAPVRDDSNIPDRNMFVMTICRICGKHCIGSGIWQRFSRLGLSSPAMAIDSSQTGEA